jgi:uncharacterized membrane protein HdeD (DUF308 family)
MLNVLARNWWVLALRGVLAILFGLLVFAQPGIALSALVALFGAYALVDGIFSVINGIRDRDTNENWWALLLEGVVSIIAGVLTFAWPGVTTVVLLYIVAAWAIVTGIFEIWAAVTLRKEIEGEFWLGLSGLVSVLFGVMLVVFPALDGILTLLWLVGIYAVAFGVMMLLLAFRLRGFQGSTRGHSPA